MGAHKLLFHGQELDNEIKGYTASVGSVFIVGVNVEIKIGSQKSITKTSTTMVSESQIKN